MLPFLFSCVGLRWDARSAARSQPRRCQWRNNLKSLIVTGCVLHNHQYTSWLLTVFVSTDRRVSCQLSNHFASQRKFCCRGLCLRSRTTITTRECGVEGRKLISTLSGVCLCIWQQRGVAGVGEKKKSKTWLHRPQPAVLQMANAKWC